MCPLNSNTRLTSLISLFKEFGDLNFEADFFVKPDSYKRSHDKYFENLVEQKELARKYFEENGKYALIDSSHIAMLVIKNPYYFEVFMSLFFRTHKSDLKVPQVKYEEAEAGPNTFSLSYLGAFLSKLKKLEPYVKIYIAKAKPALLVTDSFEIHLAPKIEEEE
jgi:hypothetical protein